MPDKLTTSGSVEYTAVQVPKIEYTVVDENGLHNLVSRVNKLIEEGWHPSGGFAAYECGDDVWYSQPMVREKQ